MSDVCVVGAALGRMSTDMQNEESPENQVRRCRERATADGVVIPDDNVFMEHAVSGTKVDREVIHNLRAAAKAGRFSTLYVEDLSRLSRDSTHLMLLLKELVFDGIRIISLNEGIDTDNESWDLVATLLGLHHERFIKDLSKKVHDGQKSAVLAGLSAGDIRFGYDSEPVPGSDRSRKGRNRRPRMRIVINLEQAEWVVRIFTWFALDGKSINWIAKELTRLGAPKDHRSSTDGWHRDYVKRVLTCEKYIGEWVWGKRRNRRNPVNGKIAQVSTPKSEWANVPVPALRIVPQQLWDAAQRRLRAIKDIYPGPYGAVGRNGSSYVNLYPNSALAGLLFCAKCGARFVRAGSNGKYMACGGIRMHRCDVRTHALRDRLVALLLEKLSEHVLSAHDNIDAALEATTRYVEEQQRERPAKLESLKAQIGDVGRKSANLLRVAEDAGDQPSSLVQRLRELEAQREELVDQIDQATAAAEQERALPTREWIVEELSVLDGWDTDDPQELARVLRAFTGGKIEMTEVKPAGKKRGYFRAKFRTCIVNVLQAAANVGDASPDTVAVIGHLQGATSEAVVIDVVPPSRAELIADDVLTMRQAGLQWKEIRHRLHCGHATVHRAHEIAAGHQAG